jgi:hypothetical protein
MESKLKGVPVEAMPHKREEEGAPMRPIMCNLGTGLVAAITCGAASPTSRRFRA